MEAYDMLIIIIILILSLLLFCGVYFPVQICDNTDNTNIQIVENNISLETALYHQIVEGLKGLPQFFISDILESDVVTTIGSEDTKLLLFDDFNCIDEGCYIGVVSSDVIEQLRKAN